MNKFNLNKILFTISFAILIIAISNCVFAIEDIDINAKSALLVEINTGKTIYEKNAELTVYPASTTKILTAIITLERCKLDDIATVSEYAATCIPEDYIVAPLYMEEQISINDLLYALMLKSSNDAAIVLAEHIGGSVEGFVEIMNQKAKEIGCKNTHFVNPNGIHDENHYTTANDLYLISKYAMENEEFVKIVSTYEYTLPSTNKYSNNDRIMQNTNHYINPNSELYNKNIIGVKTGTTLQAGNCLVSYIKKNDFDLISVVLGSETDETKFSETNKLINYFFDNYTYNELYKKNEVIQNIFIEDSSSERQNLNIIISDDINVLHHKNIDTAELQPEILINDNLKPPIFAGQKVGTIKYTIEGQDYSADLLAGNSIFIKSDNIKIIMGAISIVLIISIILLIIKAK